MISFDTFTNFLSFFILVGHVFIVFLLVLHIPLACLRTAKEKTLSCLSNHGQVIALIVAVTAVIAPLTYSNLFHLTPCHLCWYQRVFMFPLSVLFITAQIRAKVIDKVPIYVLCALGTGTSLFHYATQRLHETNDLLGSVGCDAVGLSASCSEYYFLSFGYITVPLMALTGFVLIAIFTFFTNR